VALFMTLSGYLFAKLLDGRNIDYPKFFWNRILRLCPLLAVVILIAGLLQFFKGADMWAYAKGVLTSPLGRGGLPNGGWSIIIEFHFYLLLPLLLWLNRRHRVMLPLLILGMIVARSMIRMKYGETQELAYHSLLGRLDQFVMGIIAFDWRRHIAGRHAVAAITFVLLAGFYYIFDQSGGFYNMPYYPSPSTAWIFIPTIEAVTYGILIAWYAESFEFTPNRFLWVLGKAGAYSYSIYLLHFFFFPKMSRAAIKIGLPTENFYMGLLVSAFFFLFMIGVGHVSYKYIEEPFLRFRSRYIRD
jgi:peptidoglycan/LPS O-acetylase OafA/YrhL